jgi:hypothetical protein
MFWVVGKGLRYLRALVRRVFIAFAAPDPPSAVYMDEMTKHNERTLRELVAGSQSL